MSTAQTGPRQNGHAKLADPTTTGVATMPAAPAAPAAPFLTVQNRWLKEQRGQAVCVQLGSGQTIRGVLEADDSYTLRLRIPGHDATALVYKHSIAYLVPDTGP